MLLRPIRRNERVSNKPAAARAFNAALSKRRIRIEHLFARLKTWRIIYHDCPMRPRTYAETSKAIAYINNLEREMQKSGSEL